MGTGTSTVTFDVKVQPRASSTAIRGIEAGRLKIALTAPPVDGAANEALVAFLAKLLGVARRNVTIVRGETSRLKTVSVQGVSVERVREVLGISP